MMRVLRKGSAVLKSNIRKVLGNKQAKQRVYCPLASMNPASIVADEPTDSLDSQSRENILQKLAKNKLKRLCNP